MPVGWALAATAVASVGGAVISSNAAKDAAQTQVTGATQAGQMQLEAARLAAQMQLGMFNTIRGDLSGYRDFGASALPGLSRLLGLPTPTTTATTNTAAPAGQLTLPGVSAAPGAGGLIIPGVNDPASQGVPAAALPPMRAGDVNYAALLQDRPDVLAEYNRVLATADRNSPQFQKVGLDRGPEGYAAYWLQNLANAPPPAGAPAVGGINFAQVLADRPDVKAEYDRLMQTADQNSPWFTEHGLDKGPEGFAQWWLANKPQDDTYEAPLHTAASAASAASPYQAPTWTQAQIDAAYPQAPVTAQPATPPPAGAPVTTAGPYGGGSSADIGSFLEGLPGYQFVKQQGIKAVTNSASAKGHGDISGAYGKGLARFVTGLADSTYADQIDRMFRVAGVGQAAANQTGAFGQAATGGAAGSLTGGAAAAGAGVINAANAAAGGTVGSANALSGGLNNAASAYLTSKILGMYAPGGAT